MAVPTMVAVSRGSAQLEPFRETSGLGGGTCIVAPSVGLAFGGVSVMLGSKGCGAVPAGLLESLEPEDWEPPIGALGSVLAEGRDDLEATEDSGAYASVLASDAEASGPALRFSGASFGSATPDPTLDSGLPDSAMPESLLPDVGVPDAVILEVGWAES